MIAVKYNFQKHRSGDSCKELPFRAETKSGDEAAVPIDLTGYTIKASFKLDLNGPVIFTMSTDNELLEITDAEAGEFKRNRFIVDLAPGTYYYDMQFTDGDGNIETYAEGTWVIVSSITE